MTSKNEGYLQDKWYFVLQCLLQTLMKSQMTNERANSQAGADDEHQQRGIGAHLIHRICPSNSVNCH